MPPFSAWPCLFTILRTYYLLPPSQMSISSLLLSPAQGSLWVEVSIRGISFFKILKMALQCVSFISSNKTNHLKMCVFFGSCLLSHFHMLTLPETLIILHFHGFHYHVVTESSCSEHYYFYLLSKSSSSSVNGNISSSFR